MKKLIAIVLLSLLTACVTPPRIETRQDAFAVSYGQLEAVAKDVQDTRASGLITDVQALQLKVQLNKAIQLTAEAEKLSGVDASSRQETAKAILQDVKQVLISHGAKVHE